MEKSTRVRIEHGSRRSMAISDETPLNSLSKKVSASDATHVQELEGIIVRRVAMVRQHAESNTTNSAYEYVLENTRHYDVRVRLSFTGSNFKVSPVSNRVKSIANDAVEGGLDKGTTSTFALAEPIDVTKNFNFDVDIKIFPLHENIRETDLEGVKLYTTVSYSGLLATMLFEALNTKDIDVEVELTIKGSVKEHSAPLPFKKFVGKGQRVLVGTIKSDSEIESHWKWQTPINEPLPADKPNVQTSELKGVKLKQTITSGEPTLVQFDVENTRDKKVHVEIDLVGDADFRTQPRPLTGTVLPGHTTFIGAVTLRGDAEVAWKFKEES